MRSNRLAISDRAKVVLAWSIAFILGHSLIGCDRSAKRPIDSGAQVAESAEPVKTSEQRSLYVSAPSSTETIAIGLDADLTSASAQAGEAIRRGLVLAIEQVNRRGGLLGKDVELVLRDHRGNPIRGVDNIRELASYKNLVAIVGGIHTPVALEELAVIHELKVPYLGPWAAGTPLVSNGYDPNFVFRVSVRDEYAGEFLVDRVIDEGWERIGIILEQTGWGRSNEEAIIRALQNRGLEPVALEWFHWGDTGITSKLQRLIDADLEVVLLISNPLEGASVVTAMARQSEEFRLPIRSHWGIAAGNFPDLVGESLRQVDLQLIQTHSFLRDDLTGREESFVNAYCEMFDDAQSARDIFSPVGTAHAYELVGMLSQAIEDCQSTDRLQVRDALEDLKAYEGLIRFYEQPFPADHHDALSFDDLSMAKFDESGVLVPIAQKESDLDR
ncbi:MAG: ABC transporter substrate-binding protein [Planctomycetota bacterium]